MKSILLSIKPKYVAKILNGDKTIEVRLRFPNYKGWVYIYCTKDNRKLLYSKILDNYALEVKHDDVQNSLTDYELNGKVVARFYCDNVEEIFVNEDEYLNTDTLSQKELLEQSCLTKDKIFEYFGEERMINELVFGCAIHISNLEIFDRPKELGEFRRWFKIFDEVNEDTNVLPDYPITKAPQSYMFIEVDE